MKKKKIAIIGSGFFGSTCAVVLSKYYEVDLYEKEHTIMCGASKANQFRFHLGYHYPRSVKTVNEIKKHFKEFVNFFGNKVIENTKNYYGVAKKASKISFHEYLLFLKKNNLKYSISNNKFFSNEIRGQILSKEKNLNYFKIKEILQKKLKSGKVKIYYKSNFNNKLIKNYHKIIIATYNNNNFLINSFNLNVKKKYQYELIEKIIIKLPKKFKNKSFMIMDGKFVCVDPYLGTNYHLLSHVKHSKLEIKKSTYPNFTHANKKYLNKGIIKDEKKSNFKSFIRDGKKFLPFLNKAKYIGSFYVIRTINIGKEKTDERLSEITKYGSKIISIFSGKWNTCVGVAKKVAKLI